MTPLHAKTWGLGLLVALEACSQGQAESPSASTLVRVHDGKGAYAQRIPGELPGVSAAGAAGAESDEADAGASGSDSEPTVNYDTTPGWIYQGQSNAKFSGTLSSNAVAVAVAIPDVESGYWVKPAGVPDPVTQQLTWSAYLDVSDDVPAGYHDVSFVAIDESGSAGTIMTYPLCVRSRVPDNFNACEPSLATPNAVISLSWDSNVDLDLQVLGPDGNLIDSKNPSTLPVGDEVDPNGGMLDRDSNAGCRIDGIRYENLAWNTGTPEGRYGIYVNLFSACGQPSVHFRVNVYVAKEADTKDSEGTGGAEALGQTLEERYSQSGVLVDFQANGGEGRGLFITEFEF